MVRIRSALNHSWDERQSPWVPLTLRAEQSFASPPCRHSSQDLLVLHCLKNQIHTGKASPALLNRPEPQPPESAETPQLPELCTHCRKPRAHPKQPSLLQNSAHPLPFAKGDSLEHLCFSKRLFPWKHHTKGRMCTSLLPRQCSCSFDQLGAPGVAGNLCLCSLPAHHRNPCYE